MEFVRRRFWWIVAVVGAIAIYYAYQQGMVSFTGPRVKTPPERLPGGA